MRSEASKGNFVSETKALGGSVWVTKKYMDFYEKNGYFPRHFHPYNCRDLGDVCSAITTNTGTTTGLGTVLVAVRRPKKRGKA